MAIGLRSRQLRPDQLPRTLSNPGLAMQRYIPDIVSGSIVSGSKDKLQALYGSIAESPSTDLYARAFARWTGVLDSLGALTSEAKIAGRVVVGMGSESVLETAISLNSLYGIPIIPGSAIKGLARHYFLDGHNKSDELRRHEAVLFGDAGVPAERGSKAAGYVTYFDAWWIPASARYPLAVDVLTTHHPRYYAGPGAKRFRAPTDFDDPTPVPFLSARGSFLIAIAGPSAEWTSMARALVTQAIGDWGIGAKTSSGYGRTESKQALGGAILELDAKPSIDREARLKELADMIHKLRPQELSKIEPILRSAAESELLSDAAHLLQDRLRAIGKWNKDTVDKPWRRAIEEALNG